MKKFVYSILSLAILTSFLCVILYTQEQKIKEREIQEKHIADSIAMDKKEKYNVFVESLGTLSFYDISLKSSFTKTTEKIKANSIYQNIKITGENCSATMKIELPSEKGEIPINLWFCSHEDSIFSISISVYQYKGSDYLKQLYYEKYRLEYATEHTDEFHIYRDVTHTWIFDDQSVNISTHYLLRKSTYERDLDSEKMLWGKTNIRDNVYFDYLKIEYQNIPIHEKVTRINEEVYQNNTKLKDEKD